MQNKEKGLSTIDNIIDSYGSNRDSLIQILLEAQTEYRWLTKPVLTRVSERLEIPINNIYNIATFYKHFSLLPQGRHSISVCLGTACHVRGATRLLDRVIDCLGIGPGQTTPDEKFTLTTVNCLGCCALGPAMVFAGEYISNPSVRQIQELITSVD